MLAQRIAVIRRKRLLQERLRKLRLRYFDHEDAGLLDKHERLVDRLKRAIKKIP